METIAVFGATGRTGIEITKQLLEKGYAVKALVRNPQKLTLSHPNLQVLQGTPMEQADVEKTIEGTQAVMVALNIARTSDWPWAKLVTPADLFKVSMTHIVNAMKKFGVRRIETVSAWGVGDSYKEVNAMFRFLINKTKVGIAYKGHEDQEKILRESDLDWTAVRPVGLTNSSKSKPIRVSMKGNKKLHMTIPRKDVARFMVENLKSPMYYKTAPCISSE